MGESGWIDVISFPKSGKTWIKYMTARLIAQRSGWTVEDVLGVIGHQRGDADGLRRDAGVRDLPYFSHGDMRLYDHDQATGAPVTRLALIVRDPRDVIISHYLNERFGFERFDGELDDFIGFDGHGLADGDPARRFGLAPMLRFLGNAAALLGRAGASHLATYESFRADPRGELARLCAFLGVDADDQAVADAVGFGDIENMRKLERSGAMSHLSLQNFGHPLGKKVRRGEVGGWRRELTAAQRSRIEAAMRERLPDALSHYLAKAEAA